MSRVIFFILMASLGITFATINIQTQREHILVNATGIEVTGNVAAKLQKYRSSGRGSTQVNTLRFYYFDEPAEEERRPVVLKAFGKEIVLSKGPPYIGEFHSYEVDGVSDSLYRRIEVGSRLPLVYLPGAPEKVWLKATVEGKTKVDPTVPIILVSVGLLLGGLTIVNWPSLIGRFKSRGRTSLEVSTRDAPEVEPSHEPHDLAASPAEVEPQTQSDLRARYAVLNVDPDHPEQGTIPALFGGQAEARPVRVMDHYAHDQSFYTDFVLLPGREIEAVQALVGLMEIGHEFCLSESQNGDTYRYVRRGADGYAIMRSDLSAGGDWEAATAKAVNEWLLEIAHHNHDLIDGRWPATYCLPQLSTQPHAI